MAQIVPKISPFGQQSVRGDLKVPYSSRFENASSSFYFLPDFKFF